MADMLLSESAFASTCTRHLTSDWSGRRSAAAHPCR
jgi:hypothetical protein